MAAPVTVRKVLFPLFALSVEVARVPWVTEEAMIAEMRLQWWRDALAEIAAGGPVRRHEVVTPLARVLGPEQAAELDEFVAVRRWDIYRDPFESTDHFTRYLDQSSGTLLWVAVQALGGGDEQVVRDFAAAAGLARWLQAIPELEARKRIPLLDGTPDGVRALARGGLERLEQARRQRHKIAESAGPALLAGWQTGTILRQALRGPARVGDGRLGPGRARSRLALMARAATGRW
jgi:hypothetical protein